MRIILCGFGVVAQSFSELLESRTHDLYSKFGLNPWIVGVFDSKGCAYNEAGLDLKKLNISIIVCLSYTKYNIDSEIHLNNFFSILDLLMTRY